VRLLNCLMGIPCSALPATFYSDETGGAESDTLINVLPRD
jgi:hypothetical protein